MTGEDFPHSERDNQEGLEFAEERLLAELLKIVRCDNPKEKATSIDHYIEMVKFYTEKGFEIHKVLYKTKKEDFKNY